MTALMKGLFCWASVFVLSGCGGGGSTSTLTSPPVTVTPPPSPTPIEKGCAGRQTEAVVDQSIRSSISWDPTHDAAILSAKADMVPLLVSNAVTRSERLVQTHPFAIAGERHG